MLPLRLLRGATDLGLRRWDFTTGTLPAPWSGLSRTGDGTYVNSSGLIASTTAPRITYDPATLACLGLLVEGQATNIKEYTEDFSTWTQNGATVATNTVIGPDGTLTADTLIGSSGFFRIYKLQAVANGTEYVFKVFVKPGSSTSIQFDFLNVRDGPIFTFGSAAWNVVGGWTTSARLWSDGWWELAVKTTSNTLNAGLGIRTSGAGATLHLWGAQIVGAANDSSYIPNPSTGSAVRVADDWYLSGAALDDAFGSGRSQFTLMVEWFHPASASDFARIFYLGTDSYSQRIDVFVLGGRVCVYLSDGTTAGQMAHSVPVAGNAIHRLAISVTGSEVRFVCDASAGGTEASAFGGAEAAEKLRLLHAPGEGWLNSTVRRVDAYPGQALTIGQMQSITS